MWKCPTCSVNVYEERCWKSGSIMPEEEKREDEESSHRLMTCESCNLQVSEADGTIEDVWGFRHIFVRQEPRKRFVCNFCKGKARTVSGIGYVMIAALLGGAALWMCLGRF